MPAIVMVEPQPIHGELQGQIMAALWRLGEGTVGQVRSELPADHRGAYTTVQTVMNRLAKRRLLIRARDGREFIYRPSGTEGEYIADRIRHALAGASSGARQAALASIIGGLRPEEFAELKSLAQFAPTSRTRV